MTGFCNMPDDPSIDSRQLLVASAAVIATVYMASGGWDVFDLALSVTFLAYAAYWAWPVPAANKWERAATASILALFTTAIIIAATTLIAQSTHSTILAGFDLQTSDSLHAIQDARSRLDDANTRLQDAESQRQSPIEKVTPDEAGPYSRINTLKDEVTNRKKEVEEKRLAAERLRTQAVLHLGTYSLTFVLWLFVLYKYELPANKSVNPSGG